MAYESLPPIDVHGFRHDRIQSRWKWAWDGLLAAVPGWEGAAGPVNLVDGVNGTLAGAVTFVQGPQSRELNFVLNTSVNFGLDTRYAITGPMTIAAMHVPGSSDESCIAAYGTSSGSSPFQFNYSHNSDLKYGMWNDEQGTNAAVTTATYALGTRNFVVGRRIGSAPAAPTLDIFVNGGLGGTLASAGNTAFIPDAGTGLWSINKIGAYPTGWQNPHVTSNVLLWTRALSDIEIAALSEDPFGLFRQDRSRLVGFVGLPTSTQRLVPDSVAASTNLTGTGTIASIQDDPDSDDTVWFTATSATSATDLRVTFSSPTANPYGLQNFRALLRKTTGAPTPTVDLQLYQNGSLVATLREDEPVTSTTGTVVQGNWVASLLTGTVNGSDVECRIVSTAGSTPAAGALPAYSAAGTIFQSVTAAQTNTALNSPTHAVGDVLVAHVAMTNSTGNSVLTSVNGTTGTSGWNLQNNGGSMYANGVLRQAFGWKVATSTSEVCSIVTTSGATTDRIQARVYCFAAADGFAATAVDDIGSASTGSSTSFTMPTVAAGGANELAVALMAIGSSATVAAATGETGGNWTEPVAEVAIGTAPAMTTAIQVSDQSGGAGISGGTATLGTTGLWNGVGFRLVPAQVTGAAVNTVEIGAIEWNARYVTGGAVNYVPMMMRAYRNMRI